MNTNIHKVLVLSLLIVAAGGVGTPAASAYMIGENWENYQQLAAEAQAILDEMMSQLYIPPCNGWSEPCGGDPAFWTTILGQDGPGWVPEAPFGAAHGASGAPDWVAAPTIRADHFWGFLEALLTPGLCVEGVAPEVMDEIRAAFEYNKAHVLATELEILSVRLTATYIITFDMYPDIRTGRENCMELPLGLGTECFDVPSLFGTFGGGPLLDELHPQLSEMLANITAAYMTLGDPRAVAYWQTFMGRLANLFVEKVLPTLLDNLKMEIDPKALLDALEKEGGEWPADLDAPEADKSEKAINCPPWGMVSGIDVTVPVDLSPITSVRIRLTDAQMCTTLENFAALFSCTYFQCLPDYLAVLPDQGDLNGDGTYNIEEYIAAGEDLDTWLITQGALYPMDPPVEPLDYYGAPFTLSVDPITTYPDVTYQWYSGLSPYAMTPIIGETDLTLSAVVDVYSYGGVTVERSYQMRAFSGECLLVYQIFTVVGPEPPELIITQQPEGGDFLPGQTATLTVAVDVAYGTPAYQWQKYIDGAWVNLVGETDASLVLSNLTEQDMAEYRVHVMLPIEGDFYLYSIHSDVTAVNVYPRWYIPIDTQPVGANLDIDDSYTMTVNSVVVEGELSYRWQLNTGTGFVDLTDWGAGNTFYTITNAQLADAGAYRAQVRLTFSPEEAYIADSALAVVTVSTGQVFRVDPTAPGPEEDGLSWATAFHTLQPAINAAVAAGGGEVWVAGGPTGAPITYGERRTESWGGTVGALIIKDNVHLLGGFEGYRGGSGIQETSRAQRARAQNSAVISGATSRNGLQAFHVVVFGTEAASAVNTLLDGFTITGGYAKGSLGKYHAFRGGGIYNLQSAPFIANCRILNNRAHVSGGGIANEAGAVNGAYPYILNTIIAGNQADRLADDAQRPLRGGGGVSNTANDTFPASAHLRFVTMVDNSIGNPGYTADGVGSGGLYAWNSTVVMSNSIVWNNAGGGLRLDKPAESEQLLRITYCALQERQPGTGNTGLNPVLDAAYMPQPGSPAIDAGDPAIVSGDDIRGVYRPLNGGTGVARADMGAFERTLNAPVAGCVDTPTIVDLALATSIGDPAVVWNPAATVLEAPVWRLHLTGNSFNCSHVNNPGVTVTLVVTDILGRTGSCAAPVTVLDTVPPVVQIPAPLVVQCNRSTFALPTVTALDNCNGTLPTVIINYDGLDPANPAVGTYLVEYSATDSSSNVGTGILSVTIEDDFPPVIALNGPSEMYIDAGVPYVDTATAVDVCDGPIALDIGYDGMNPADPAVGTYVLTYNAIDAAGNAAPPLTRTVHVMGDARPHVVSVAVVDMLNVAVTFNKAMGASALVPGNYTVSGSGLGTLSAVPVNVSTLDNITHNLEWNCPAHIMLNGGDILVEVNPAVADSGDNPMSMPMSGAHLGGAVAAAPVITRLGDAVVSVECTDPYVDAGATAEDACGSALTVSVSGDVVDPNAPATYIIRYDATDAAGNVAAQVTRTVNVVDTTPPLITLLGDPAVILNCGDPYTDAGATAADDCDGNLSSAIVVGGTFTGTSVPGDYTITYNVHDAGGNPAPTVTRAVTVVAPGLPLITLLGDPAVNAECGLPYVDAGATAADACGNNITGSIVVGGDVVNTSVLGAVYTITYDVMDNAGNPAPQVTRNVTIVDNTPPVITRLGLAEVNVECGSVYVDAGATATDGCDGPISVTVGGDFVDTSVLGAVYTVTYDAMDTAGNPAAQVTRTVTIVDTIPPVISLVGGAFITTQWNAPYVDPGATAADDCDDDVALTAAIVIDDSDVDTSVLGSVGIVTYNVIDTAGNPAVQVTRTVHVADGIGPIVTNVEVESANTVLVTFCCGDMDVDTVFDPLNYLVGGSGVGSLSPHPDTVAHVSGGTYRLTWPCPAIMYNGGDIEVTVADVVEDDAGNPMADPKSGVHIGGAVAAAPVVRSAIVDAPDCQDRIIPTAILASSGTFTGGTVDVTRILEDPVLENDGLWIQHSSGSSATLRIAMENPNPGCLAEGIQTFRVRLRKNSSHASSHPTVTIRLYEGGVERANLGTVTLNNDALDPGVVYSFVWDTALISDPDNVEMHVTFTRVGGITSYRYAHLGSADWVPIFETELVPIPEITAECSVEITEIPDDAPATDACGNPLTADITSDDDIDRDNPTVGVYTIVYTATDAAGNTGTTTLTVNVEDTIAPVVTIPGDDPLIVNCGDTLTLPEATADDDCDDAVTASISNYGGLTPATPAAGTYTVTYSATDASNNTGTAQLTVQVLQSAAPQLEIDGPDEITVECAVPMVMPTATATDSCGTSLTVTISDYDGLNPANPATGEYTVVYSAVDNEAQEVTAELTVIVEDTTPPVITLLGEAEIVMLQGDEYEDAGATAWDDCDGNLTDDIVVDNPVDVNEVGEYLITYNVSDAEGNTAEQVTRTVTVIDAGETYVLGVSVIDAHNAAITFNKPMGENALDPANYEVSGSGRGSLSANPISVAPDEGNTFILTWECPDIMLNGGDITIIVAEIVEDALGNMMTAPRDGTDIGAAVATAPVITPPAAFASLPCGVPITAEPEATDACDNPLAVSLIDDDGLDLENPVAGAYTLVYSAEDAAGNVTTTPFAADVVDLPPVVTIDGPNPLIVNCATEVILPDATVWDDCDGIALAVEITDLGGLDPDNPALGTYLVVYTTVEPDSSDQYGTATLTVQTVPPQLVIVGPTEIVAECTFPITLPEVTAEDDCGNDLTDDIVVNLNGLNPDVPRPGEYLVTYSITDVGGISSLFELPVTVLDAVGPTVTVLGDNPMYLEPNEPYVEQGVEAHDLCDGPVLEQRARFIPDAILAQSAMTGGVDRIQEPPTDPDDLWITTTTDGAWLHLSFDAVKAWKTFEGTQQFRIRARRNNNAANPYFTVLLMENGVQVANLGTVDVTAQNPGSVFTFNWNIAQVSDPRNVEIRINTNRRGDGASSETFSYVNIGAVDWVPNYSAATPIPELIIGGYLEEATVDYTLWVVTYDGIADKTDNVGDQVTRLVYLEPTSPFVEAVTVVDPWTVRVTFSLPMGGGVFNPFNYTLSGSGRGTFPDTPDVVLPVDERNFDLVWNCPWIMIRGGDITIDVDEEVESAGDVRIDLITSGTHVGGAMADGPFIALNGDAEMVLAYASTYDEPGATAQDACGNDLTDLIVIGGDTVDTYTLGAYYITYDVTDALGNDAEPVVRTVIVSPEVPLTIVKDLEDLHLVIGQSDDWSIEVIGGAGEHSYQWFRFIEETSQFEPITDGPFTKAAFSGAQTNTLRIEDCVMDMAGLYQVEVSDFFDTVIAGPAELHVGTGVPATGLLGLAALALATALGGATVLRRRKQK